MNPSKLLELDPPDDPLDDPLDPLPDPLEVILVVLTMLDPV